MADRSFELSRRNALLGIGTIGVASVGAGLGTSAYFSDQETFEGNTIRAGEFSMTVDQYIKHVDQDGIGPDEMAFNDEDGDDYAWMVSPIEIMDAKPGDKYKFCWDITIHDNPGYVTVAGDYTDETGYEASNVDADDLWDIEDNDDLKTLGEAATAKLVTIVRGKDDNNDHDDYEDKHVHEYDNLKALLESLKNGIIVSDGDGPITFEPGKMVTVCVVITIPTDVGNEIQGAVTTTDMTFYAEQTRHNDPEDVRDNAVEAVSG